MTTETNGIALDDLFSAEDLAKQYPKVLRPETLIWQLRNRDQNGLAAAVVKIGKRLMISKSRYERWLADQAGAV